MPARKGALTDRPEVEAEIALRRRALDRHSVMAVVGMAVIVGIFVFDPGDHDRTMAALLETLPWLIGLSVLVIVANRVTLAVQAKSIRERRDAPRAGGA